MREYSTPPTYTLPAVGNLTDDLVSNARIDPSRVVVSRRVGSQWHDVSAAELLAHVREVARGLIAAGVAAGDRVALISRTRYEWMVLDYAIWYAGAVTVPIYDTSSAPQAGWILSDSGSVLAVAETADHADRVESVRGDLPRLRRVVIIDDCGLEELIAGGRGVSESELEARRSEVTPSTAATVIYTSGTTGQPKGCVLTHGNFMVELGVATTILDDLFETQGASTLLFLPLAHVFARILQVGAIRRRVRLGHSADVVHLLDDLSAFQPTFILAVPRDFEKMFNTASQRATADGRGKVFDAAVAVAVKYSQATDRSGPGPLLRARHAMFDRLVYRRLRSALGGKVQYAVSGGAPLGERLTHFFRGAGVPVLEGYGLTETTGALSVNQPGHQRIGTVGTPLPGTSVRVADDGELQFRGGQVFAGYWHDDEATAAALGPDGWLRTGDLGELDDDGFVRITGRKEEILVTAGGKNVAPSVLEDRIRAHRLVSQCMVVGDGKPFVAALITLDPDAAPFWMQRRGKSGSLSSLLRDPDLLLEVQTAVDAANATVSRAEAIRKFAVLGVDWSEETGELTPTLKLKRALVMRRFHTEVESLYA